MSTDPESKITEDGLRYKRKASGTPFPNIGSRATISCYKCGLHKPRSMGTFKKLINQRAVHVRRLHATQVALKRCYRKTAPLRAN